MGGIIYVSELYNSLTGKKSELAQIVQAKLSVNSNTKRSQSYYNLFQVNSLLQT